MSLASAPAIRMPKLPVNRITFPLTGPVAKLHWIEQSLFFAELSRIVYFPIDIVRPIAFEGGLDTCDFIERDGAQAYIFSNRDDLLVVCRGTEPHDWNDLRADANALTVLFEVGRLHSGFKSEVDHLWPKIETAIRDNTRPAWFSGHSLGGAMATICAGRCKISSISSNPYSVFTFGSPRVGNRKFVQAVKLPHYRWVHNNDIVTRIPPRWFGYKHSGFELYCDNAGALRNLFSWQRSRDRLMGLYRGLFRGSLDFLSDHAMIEYIRVIRGVHAEFLAGKKLIEPRINLDA